MTDNQPRNGVRTALVVGAGIAGLSCAWALARRGIQVEVFEQGAIPNPKSASYDEHRINRHAYGRLDGYAQLMPSAFRIWEEMWCDLGTCHYEETGGVYVLRQEDGWYEATSASLDTLGIAYRTLTSSELAERVPMIEPRGVERAIEVAGSGMLFPQRILTDLVTHLPARGVRLHSETAIREVRADLGQISTSTGQTHEADIVVVTAGAWVDRLIPALKGVAVASRQAVMYLSPPATLSRAWSQAPVIVVRDGDDGLYTLPPRRGTRLKIGDHRFSRTGNADDDRQGTDSDVARLWRGLRRSYRYIDQYSVLERKACFYTVTEDESFHVAPIGMRGWVMSACSGHGFKLAPLISDGIARAVAGQAKAENVPTWAAGKSGPILQ